MDENYNIDETKSISIYFSSGSGDSPRDKGDLLFEQLARTVSCFPNRSALIRDRDGRFTREFDEVFGSGSIA
jgi:hypothetical protein